MVINEQRSPHVGTWLWHHIIFDGSVKWTTAKSKVAQLLSKTQPQIWCEELLFWRFNNSHCRSCRTYVRRKLETKQTNEQSIDNDSIKTMVVCYCSLLWSQSQPKQSMVRGKFKNEMRVLNISLSIWPGSWQLKAIHEQLRANARAPRIRWIS